MPKTQSFVPIAMISLASLMGSCGKDKSSQDGDAAAARPLAELGLSKALAPTVPVQVTRLGTANLTLHEGKHYPSQGCRFRNLARRSRLALTTLARAICHFEAPSAKVTPGGSYKFRPDGSETTFTLTYEASSLRVCVDGKPALAVTDLTSSDAGLAGRFVAKTTTARDSAAFALDGRLLIAKAEKPTLVATRLTMTETDGSTHRQRLATALGGSGVQLISLGAAGRTDGYTFTDTGSFRVTAEHGSLLYRTGEEVHDNGTRFAPLVYRYYLNENGEALEQEHVTEPAMAVGGNIYATKADMPPPPAADFAADQTGLDGSCDGASELKASDDAAHHAACEALLDIEADLNCNQELFQAGYEDAEFSESELSTGFDELTFPPLE